MNVTGSGTAAVMCVCVGGGVTTGPQRGRFKFRITVHRSSTNGRPWPLQPLTNRIPVSYLDSRFCRCDMVTVHRPLCLICARGDITRPTTTRNDIYPDEETHERFARRARAIRSTADVAYAERLNGVFHQLCPRTQRQTLQVVRNCIKRRATETSSRDISDERSLTLYVDILHWSTARTAYTRWR